MSIASLSFVFFFKENIKSCVNKIPSKFRDNFEWRGASSRDRHCPKIIVSVNITINTFGHIVHYEGGVVPAGKVSSPQLCRGAETRRRETKWVRMRKTYPDAHKQITYGFASGTNPVPWAKQRLGKGATRGFLFDIQFLRMISLKFVIDCNSYELRANSHIFLSLSKKFHIYSTCVPI